MAITQLDTEANNQADIFTAAYTVLTKTPSGTVDMLCQALVILGDPDDGLDGTGGTFELVITIDGVTIQPSPQEIEFSTDVKSGVWSTPFPVPATNEVVITVQSPNAADTTVDTLAYLYDISDSAQLALVANNLDHWSFEPVNNNDDMTDEVPDGTVCSNLISATSDTSTFIPGTDSLEGIGDHVGQISIGTAAVSVAANSASVLTTGSETNDYTATVEPDGTLHTVTPDGGAIDMRYAFLVGAGGTGTTVTWRGYVQTNGDTVLVKANKGTHASPSWELIETLSGVPQATLTTVVFDLYATHTMTGTDIGKVEIQFSSGGGTVATALATDRIFCSYGITSLTAGYANGMIWVDTTNGTAGTVRDVNGTVERAVLTWAHALALNTQLKLNHFHLASGTSITLTGGVDGYVFNGDNATVVLDGQSVSGTEFNHLTISGNDDTSNATATHYHECQMGTHTLGLYEMYKCELTGDITLAEIGTYFMDSCTAKATLPSIDFGALGNTTMHLNRYCGNIEVKRLGATGTDTMFMGGRGHLTINANSTPGGILHLFGHISYTDNVAGGGFVANGGEINDDARYDVANMRGTDDANTTTPPTVEQIDAELSSSHGSGTWGGGAGDGSVEVDHTDTDTDTNPLTYKTAGGDGIDNATVQAYLASDTDAGDWSNLIAETTTNVNGEWVSPLSLDPETYTIKFYKQGEYGPDLVTVEVS